MAFIVGCADVVVVFSCSCQGRYGYAPGGARYEIRTYEMRMYVLYTSVIHGMVTHGVSRVLLLLVLTVYVLSVATGNGQALSLDRDDEFKPDVKALFIAFHELRNRSPRDLYCHGPLRKSS